MFCFYPTASPSASEATNPSASTRLWNTCPCILCGAGSHPPTSLGTGSHQLSTQMLLLLVEEVVSCSCELRVRVGPGLGSWVCLMLPFLDWASLLQTGSAQRPSPRCPRHLRSCLERQEALRTPLLSALPPFLSLAHRYFQATCSPIFFLH